MKYFQKPKTYIVSLTILLSLTTFSKSQCLVDRCLSCDNATTTLCNACNSGYTKMTFSGATTTYNDCWSTWKIWLSIIGSLCLCYICCALWYVCYRYGMSKLSKAGVKASAPVQAAPRYISAPVATQPSVYRDPTVVYSPPRSPARVIRPSNYVSALPGRRF